MDVKNLLGDPCPCGSGKARHDCCGATAGRATPSSPSQDLKEMLQEELRKRGASTLEEANAIAREVSERHNRAPRDDFAGLSSEQMMRLLYYPFDSPEVVEFPETLDSPPAAPILTLVRLLGDMIDPKGLKLTEAGYLPVRVVDEVVRQYPTRETYAIDLLSMFGRIRTEREFLPLHTARVVAGVAGLTRKNRGRLMITRKGRQLLDDPAGAKIYPLLLRAYAEKFNWNYMSWRQQPEIVQASFAWTLWLLKRFGGETRPVTFYEDHFLRAFPAALTEYDDTGLSPELKLRIAYHIGALRHFAEFFGLAQADPAPPGGEDSPAIIRSMPLLDAAVRFHI